MLSGGSVGDWIGLHSIRCKDSKKMESAILSGVIQRDHSTDPIVDSFLTRNEG